MRSRILWVRENPPIRGNTLQTLKKIILQLQLSKSEHTLKRKQSVDKRKKRTSLFLEVRSTILYA